mmetsp:Transcript_38401/g.105766  ORF Transcript_38401/g.105766 Transcript_38401/m.105766 type:complete len:335 (+) Transcript_38401:684-1688(+)
MIVADVVHVNLAEAACSDRLPSGVQSADLSYWVPVHRSQLVPELRRGREGHVGLWIRQVRVAERGIPRPHGVHRGVQRVLTIHPSHELARTRHHAAVPEEAPQHVHDDVVVSRAVILLGRSEARHKAVQGVLALRGPCECVHDVVSRDHVTLLPRGRGVMHKSQRHPCVVAGVDGIFQDARVGVVHAGLQNLVRVRARQQRELSPRRHPAGGAVVHCVKIEGVHAPMRVEQRHEGIDDRPGAVELSPHREVDRNKRVVVDVEPAQLHRVLRRAVVRQGALLSATAAAEVARSESLQETILELGPTEELPVHEREEFVLLWRHRGRCFVAAACRR